MKNSNEQWFSVDGQLIDNKLVFNIHEFNGSARYEKTIYVHIVMVPAVIASVMQTLQVLVLPVKALENRVL
jgi:hypothetical protein